LICDLIWTKIIWFDLIICDMIFDLRFWFQSFLQRICDSYLWSDLWFAHHCKGVSSSGLCKISVTKEHEALHKRVTHKQQTSMYWRANIRMTDSASQLTCPVQWYSVIGVTHSHMLWLQRHRAVRQVVMTIKCSLVVVRRLSSLQNTCAQTIRSSCIAHWPTQAHLCCPPGCTMTAAGVNDWAVS